MKKWLRKLCPSYIGISYGNYCGANNTCKAGDKCPPPTDQLDLACLRHDICLAKQTDKSFCDAKLGQAIRKVDARKLSWYGRLYLAGMKLVFKP